MTLYEYFNQFPDEQLSRLQAARVYPRHTMRNLTIYRDYLALQANPPRPCALTVLGRMDFYTLLSERHALSEGHIRAILANMDRQV